MRCNLLRIARWTVKLVSDLSLLSFNSEENVLNTLLDQVLTPTDFSIIDAVARYRNENGKPPTASEIKAKLSRASQLKKTQLYDRLNRLTHLGFLSAKVLPRPRRYIADKNTITRGVERWMEEQRASITSLSSELESLRNFLNGLNAKSFATALAERMSLDFESVH